MKIYDFGKCSFYKLISMLAISKMLGWTVVVISLIKKDLYTLFIINNKAVTSFDKTMKISA